MHENFYVFSKTRAASLVYSTGLKLRKNKLKRTPISTRNKIQI